LPSACYPPKDRELTPWDKKYTSPFLTAVVDIVKVELWPRKLSRVGRRGKKKAMVAMKATTMVKSTLILVSMSKWDIHDT